MHRTSLSFLEAMFPCHDLEKFYILIINQTGKGYELNSTFKNIRVINSYETGLSLSRNLAIKNATGDICLIADDDVEYLPNFQQKILEVFLKHPLVSIFQFRIETFCGLAYKDYPKSSKKLVKNQDLKKVSSIEIAFKRMDIIEKGIWFNPCFGLGSYFKSGEEYLFLKKASQSNLVICFENLFIVKHKFERSTANVGSDDSVKAKSALYFNEHKNLSYLFVLRFIYILFKMRKIEFKEIAKKYKVGLNAIKEYKDLKRLHR
ncbi:glycosyltransferase family A protein [Gelatiniphilus marinus]|uniref:Glycosyltransferase family A protein n=1 Tax=Gelatiniphilus marinus TaxID=1759464 RepID=A0ABW5JPZ4_9FLAO